MAMTPIAVTDVELLKVVGASLVICGLDAINETPVLDIKVAMQSLKLVIGMIVLCYE
jgi:tRNA (Thr-GGU) A37 N-methylase